MRVVDHTTPREPLVLLLDRTQLLRTEVCIADASSARVTAVQMSHLAVFGFLQRLLACIQQPAVVPQAGDGGVNSVAVVEVLHFFWFSTSCAMPCAASRLNALVSMPNLSPPSAKPLLLTICTKSPRPSQTPSSVLGRSSVTSLASPVGILADTAAVGILSLREEDCGEYRERRSLTTAGSGGSDYIYVMSMVGDSRRTGNVSTHKSTCADRTKI